VSLSFFVQFSEAFFPLFFMFFSLSPPASICIALPLPQHGHFLSGKYTGKSSLVVDRDLGRKKKRENEGQVQAAQETLPWGSRWGKGGILEDQWEIIEPNFEFCLSLPQST
jgi:hypothetical protein